MKAIKKEKDKDKKSERRSKREDRREERSKRKDKSADMETLRGVKFAYGGKVYAKAGTMIPEMANDPGLLAQMKKEVEKRK